MTREQEQRLAGYVENPVFKGLARLLMYVSALFLGLIVWNGNRAFETMDRLDRNQTKLDARLDRLEIMAANDRKAAGDRDGQLNTRIDLSFSRINDFEHNFARTNDMRSGLELRDQRIEGIDRRLGGLESRLNGPAAH